MIFLYIFIFCRLFVVLHSNFCLLKFGFVMRLFTGFGIINKRLVFVFRVKIEVNSFFFFNYIIFEFREEAKKRKWNEMNQEPPKMMMFFDIFRPSKIIATHNLIIYRMVYPNFIKWLVSLLHQTLVLAHLRSFFSPLIRRQMISVCEVVKKEWWHRRN